MFNDLDRALRRKRQITDAVRGVLEDIEEGGQDFLPALHTHERIRHHAHSEMQAEERRASRHMPLITIELLSAESHVETRICQQNTSEEDVHHLARTRPR